MAGENEGRQDIDISTGKGIGGPEGGGDAGKESTQTRKDGEGTGGESQTQAGSGEGTGTEGGGASGEGGDGSGKGGDEGDVNPQTGKPWTTEEWRDKFRASAKGANDLLTQVNTLKGDSEAKDTQIAKLTKDMEDLRKLAEGKNPEGLSAHDLQAALEKTTSELAVLKENGELDAFEKKTPLAVSKRETLRSLARANPKADLQTLWDNNLKAGAEAEAAAEKARKDAQGKGAGEKGKGTSTREPAGGGNTIRGAKGDTGLTLEEFNKLPVGERRRLMEKYDIR